MMDDHGTPMNEAFADFLDRSKALQSAANDRSTPELIEWARNALDQQAALLAALLNHDEVAVRERARSLAPLITAMGRDLDELQKVLGLTPAAAGPPPNA